jgi:hypothetical protein
MSKEISGTKIASYSDVKAKIKLTETSEPVDAFIQSISYNVAKQTDRLMALGTANNTPFAAYPAYTLSLRNVSLKETEATASLPKFELKQYIPEISIYSLNNERVASFTGCYVISKAKAVQAGTVLIYDDFSLECEDGVIENSMDK